MEKSLYVKQLAYQVGKFTINGLQCLIEGIKKTLVAKEIALWLY